MSLGELQVRTWLHEWEEFNNIKPYVLESWKTVPPPSPFIIRAVKNRKGVRDYYYHHYKSIAYEVDLDGIVARAEGRDALERLIIVMNNYTRLRKEQ
jgi:hypothetical protein